MSKIVVIGSLNMDLCLQAPRVPRMGETLTGRSFKTIPGGKGANQAAACASLGSKSAIIGRVGRDGFADVLKSSLSAFGTDISGIITDDTEKTGVAMIIVAEGENMIVLSPGANGNVSPADIEAKASLVEEADIILMQLEIPLATVAYVVNKYKNNKTIFLNPAPIVDLKDEILSGLDYITPNEHEAALLCGVDTSNESGIFQALDKLRAKGVKHPVITLGHKGAAYFSGSEKKIAKAFMVAAVDTTAAGDTFTGALAVAISEGEDMDAAISFAQRAAALAVTKYGAQTSIPNRKEAENFRYVL